jgi:hypothetical protein
MSRLASEENVVVEDPVSPDGEHLTGKRKRATVRQRITAY